jgi:ketopantoate reductase
MRAALPGSSRRRSSRAAPLAAWLRAAGFAARVSRSIDAARYRKLLANVCINPVTAIFNVRNGEVRERAFGARRQDPPTHAIRHVMEVARRTAANRLMEKG